ncbi:hypothetical protein R3P38DRAFT_3068653, partial [Favolaschia claudopus]
MFLFNVRLLFLFLWTALSDFNGQSPDHAHCISLRLGLLDFYTLGLYSVFFYMQSLTMRIFERFRLQHPCSPVHFRTAFSVNRTLVV